VIVDFAHTLFPTARALARTRSRRSVAWGLASLLLLAGNPAPARPLAGVVRCAQTGQPIADATVQVEGGDGRARTAADGQFTLEVPENEALRLSAAAPGFLPAWSPALPPDFTGPLELRLPPQPTDPLFATVVTATRATSGRTPATFTNLDAAELQQRSWGQDLPILLESQPGVFATSDAGNGIGYTTLQLRGFDARRVGVQIDGVPLNDPAEQLVYWVDVPDLASSLQDVQVQRGIGFAGTSHFGGTINLVTDDAALTRRFELTTGLGSFGTFRNALRLGSGLVDNKYSISGRFSRVVSDGYRERSGSELWGYFLTARRFGPSWSLRLTTFGGQEQTRLAFNGTPASLLAAGERRLNLDDYYAAPDSPANTYPKSLDHFQQPHTQLSVEWRPLPELELRTTLYVIQGRGWYQGYKADRDLADFGFPDSDAESDLIRRKHVAKLELGTVGQAAWRREALGLTLGWSLDWLSSDHWGELLWIAAPPAQDGWPDDYYRYTEEKTTLSTYLDAEYRLLSSLRLLGELQLRHGSFAFRHADAGSFGPAERYEFTDARTLLNPKLGLLYDLVPRPAAAGGGSAPAAATTLRQGELYLLVGKSGREPAADDYWDAWQGPDDRGAAPLFRTFTANEERVQATGSRLNTETLLDVELGSRWSLRPDLPGLRSLSATLALYWMDFRNEILTAGGVDDDGNPVKGNAKRSIHRGLEGSLRLMPWRGLALTGNLTLADNVAVDLIQRTWDEEGQVVQLDRGGNPLPGTPVTLANLGLAWSVGPATLELTGSHTGRRYLDLSGLAERSLDPYFLLHAGARLELERRLGLERLQLALTVRNLLDTPHETHGWWDEWYGDGGEAILFPGAPRQVHLSLTLGL
jgi:iron complex outermembrane receptor protein